MNDDALEADLRRVSLTVDPPPAETVAAAKELHRPPEPDDRQETP